MKELEERGRGKEGGEDGDGKVIRREAINEGIGGEKKGRRGWVIEDDGDGKE